MIPIKVKNDLLGGVSKPLVEAGVSKQNLEIGDYCSGTWLQEFTTRQGVLIKINGQVATLQGHLQVYECALGTITVVPDRNIQVHTDTKVFVENMRKLLNVDHIPRDR